MPQPHRPRTAPSARRSVVLAAACAAMSPLLATSPAQAVPPPAPPDRVTRATTTDLDDTRGPLDLARVSHRVAVYGTRHVRVAYTLRTYDRFRTTDLNKRHRNLTIELAKDPRPGATHNITVYARHGRLRADLISNATRKPVARLAVHRVGPRAIRVRGPRRLVGARRYFVVSRYERSSAPPCGWAGERPVTCGDQVPDRGWLRMDRPAWPRSSP